MSNSEKEFYEMLSKPSKPKGQLVNIYPDDFNNKLNKAMEYIFEQEKLDAFNAKLDSMGITAWLIGEGPSRTLLMDGAFPIEQMHGLINEYCELLNKKIVGEITHSGEEEAIIYQAVLESK